MSPSNATAKLMKSWLDLVASPKFKCFDKAMSKVLYFLSNVLLLFCQKGYLHFAAFRT